ncbi:MAG: hypothetical protein M3P39_08980, partial [Actinomycetota bacterium]|nr:hypothetical protein [Actinomycetota bacterium]
DLRPGLGVVPRVAVAAVLGALPALLLPGAPVVLTAAAGVALFALAALATRAVPDEVVVEARRLLRR